MYKKFIKFVFSNLTFYRWTSAALFLTVALSAAVLCGSLAVGDSVDHSLLRMLEARLGGISAVMHRSNRFFRKELADEVAAKLDTYASGVVSLRGMVTDGEDQRLVNEVDVFGVEYPFFKIGNAARNIELQPGRVALNRPLAERLGVGVDDEVILRVPRPSMMPRDAALTPKSQLTRALRLQVAYVLGPEDFGWFGLNANQTAPLNAFLSAQWLAEQLDRPGQANTIVLDGRDSDISAADANAVMGDIRQPGDAELQFQSLAHDVLELRSHRVFINPVLGKAAMQAGEQPLGILTYFVNEIRAGERSTPYSTVAAMGPSDDDFSLVAPDMDDQEVVINEWLAEDLEVVEGDEIELVYYILDFDRQLKEAARSFVVRDIVPIEGAAADRTLMPDYPGLADVDNCRDWEPGLPIDLNKIREKDELYWENYRGVPKAFVTLEAGQNMWANPYGELTAVRYGPEHEKKNIAEDIFRQVKPAEIGLLFRDVRAEGISARQEAMGFGQLFIGFNMFLIAASLVLVGLVFAFAVEGRADQIGMLKAVGYPNKTVRKLFLFEGGALTLLGVVFGAFAGLGYTRLMIRWLARAFGEAGRYMIIEFDVNSLTVLGGAGATFLMAVVVIALCVRTHMRRPAKDLLEGGATWQIFTDSSQKGKNSIRISVVCFIAALVLVIAAGRGKTGAEAAGVFFGVGSLLLISVLAFFHSMLTRTAGIRRRPMDNLSGLAFRNAARRSGRTLAVITMLSAGIFIVIAVGANRQNVLGEAHRKDSGTGGFALLGRAAINIPFDLTNPEGRESVHLEVDRWEKISIAQMRVHDGDDASCFNINRAQKPQLLGINPDVIEDRFAFVDRMETTGREASGWSLLKEDFGDGIVPAIGDQATVRWALGKTVGDEIEYTDRSGGTFRIRIAGVINSSVLQGNLMIAESDFRERFATDGYGLYLVDAPGQYVEEVREVFDKSLRDFGLEILPARERLAEFAAVENTYISMFQILGGFGLIVGSLGLGLVVLRNIQDRRGELAILQAIGYKKKDLKKMIFFEHIGMMPAGLLSGVLAALVAVSPQITGRSTDVPYLSLALIIMAIFVCGFFWIGLAVRFSLSGDFYDALRDE